MFRNMLNGTTAWVATTMVSAGSMIGTTIYAANKLNSLCSAMVEPVRDFAAGSVHTPIIHQNLMLDIPELLGEFLGKSVTVFAGQTLIVPLNLQSFPIPVAPIIGASATSFLDNTPDLLGKICYYETIAFGTAYALTIVGLAALTTYAYAKNRDLKIELAKLANNTDHASATPPPLPPRLNTA